MTKLFFRRAKRADIPAMAEIRGGDWGDAAFWRARIAQYLARESHPQHALEARMAYVCVDGERVVGLIAGHLTRRFGCEGELQWVSVLPEHRGRGVAAELLRRLAKWFLRQRARRICVDVEPKNERARGFYIRQGARDLKPHWMLWDDIGQVLRKRSDLESAAST